MTDAEDDKEIERIMALTPEEVIAETIANGDDPAEIVRRFQACMERALKAAQERDWRGPVSCGHDVG